jgi:hypothetical protein
MPALLALFLPPPRELTTVFWQYPRRQAKLVIFILLVARLLGYHCALLVHLIRAAAGCGELPSCVEAMVNPAGVTMAGGAVRR